MWDLGLGPWAYDFLNSEQPSGVKCALSVRYSFTSDLRRAKGQGAYHKKILVGSGAKC